MTRRCLEGAEGLTRARSGSAPRRRDIRASDDPASMPAGGRRTDLGVLILDLRPNGGVEVLRGFAVIERCRWAAPVGRERLPPASARGHSAWTLECLPHLDQRRPGRSSLRGSSMVTIRSHAFLAAATADLWEPSWCASCRRRSRAPATGGRRAWASAWPTASLQRCKRCLGVCSWPGRSHGPGAEMVVKVLDRRIGPLWRDFGTAREIRPARPRTSRADVASSTPAVETRTIRRGHPPRLAAPQASGSFAPLATSPWDKA